MDILDEIEEMNNSVNKVLDQCIKMQANFAEMETRDDDIGKMIGGLTETSNRLNELIYELKTYKK